VQKCLEGRFVVLIFVNLPCFGDGTPILLSQKQIQTVISFSKGHIFGKVFSM